MMSEERDWTAYIRDLETRLKLVFDDAACVYDLDLAMEIANIITPLEQRIKVLEEALCACVWALSCEEMGWQADGKNDPEDWPIEKWSGYDALIQGRAALAVPKPTDVLTPELLDNAFIKWKADYGGDKP
jgi:hypothetical protein